MATINELTTRPLVLLSAKAIQAKQDAAAAYRDFGAALAEKKFFKEATMAYEESLRLHQPGQGEGTVRLKELHNQWGQNAHPLMGGSKDYLEALVRQALINARRNGYRFEGRTNEQIAEDMLEKDVDIEGKNRDDVIAAVAAIRKENDNARREEN